MSFATDSATEPADKSGFLELRGFKHKLFVVVVGDKVFLYKNAEVGCRGGCGTMGNPDHFKGDPFLLHSQPEQSSSEPGHPGPCHPLNGDSIDTNGCCPLSPSLLALSLGISQEHHTHCSCFQSLWCPRYSQDESWAGKGRSCPSSQALDPIIHLPLIPCLPQDYRLGIGITYIEMNVGNVKEVDRRGFDLTTPYRIFR